MMMAPITYFWGPSTEIVFPVWPGRSFSFYISASICVFHMSLLVEWLSHAHLITSCTNHLTPGLLQTLMYAFRMQTLTYAFRIALAYLVKLPVMSLDIRVFLAAVAGYSVGFFIFGSQVFRKFKPEPSDLPPRTC